MPVEHLTIEKPEELMEIVSKELEGIEKGLKIIGRDLPVDEKTKVGMLCHDENGQLVIVEPTLEEGENLVIQALKCADFVDRFKMMLAATNPKSKIDVTKPPRVILLLPECSEETIRLVKRIKEKVKALLRENFPQKRNSAFLSSRFFISSISSFLNGLG